MCNVSVEIELKYVEIHFNAGHTYDVILCFQFTENSRCGLSGWGSRPTMCEPTEHHSQHDQSQQAWSGHAERQNKWV